MRSDLKSSDQITVLVFKDNHAARTFQISLRWISKFGIFLGFLAALALLSVYFAFQYYRLRINSDPFRIQDLEQEISELKSARTVEAKAVTPAPEASIPSQGEPSIPLLFSALPTSVHGPFPAVEEIPIKILPPRISWSGHTLKVNFALQYRKDDEKSQEGRIFVFARGPEAFLAYPAEAIEPAGSPHLVNPEKGESFHVSRYREVKASFESVQNRGALREVEILILKNDGAPLFYQKLPIPASRAGNPNKSSVETEKIQEAQPGESHE